MEPELFTPSIDWATAPLDSLIWIGKAWVISAVCLVVVLIVLRYTTVWGRQFWCITTATSSAARVDSGMGDARSAVALDCLSVCVSTCCSATTATTCTRALQTAFEGTAAGDDAVCQSGIHGFWGSIVVFCVLATLYIAG